MMSSRERTTQPRSELQQTRRTEAEVAPERPSPSPIRDATAGPSLSTRSERSALLPRPGWVWPATARSTLRPIATDRDPRTGRGATGYRDRRIATAERAEGAD